MRAALVERTSPLLVLFIILSTSCASAPERSTAHPAPEFDTTRTEEADAPAAPEDDVSGQGASSEEEEELVMAIDGGFIEIDGLRLMQVHCSPSEPLQMLSWVMQLSEKRAALDACAPSGAAFALQFPAESAPTLLTSSDEAANACVLSELSAAPRPQAADCRALLLIGERDAAMQAAASLLEGGDS
ncbi:MAG: hypothetical protein RBU37_13785 [Myxococcota bacterium]|nr:hypothetical protein [Myxococcota bacterium]